MPALDGLRGVAILMVLAFHSPFAKRVPGGFVGVDVFFVLSGFLITALLLDEWRTSGTARLPAFFARRALRLLPALACFLAAVWLLVEIVPADPSISHLPLERSLIVGPTLKTLAYVANWGLAFERHRWPDVFAHLWSLSIEGQFYLLWAPLLIVLLRRRIALVHILIGVLAFTVVASVWRGVVFLDAKSYARPFFSSDTRLAGLFTGVAVAITLSLLRPRPRRWLGVLAWPCFGVLGACVALLHYKEAPAYLGGLTVVHLVSAMLVAGALLAPNSWAARALAAPPLTWLGRLSYSMYLCHYPIFFLVVGIAQSSPAVETVLAITVSLLVASASYYGIERPFLRAGRPTRVAVPRAGPGVNRVTPRTPSAPIPAV